MLWIREKGTIGAEWSFYFGTYLFAGIDISKHNFFEAWEMFMALNY